VSYQIEERIPGGSWQVSPGSVLDETYPTRDEAERVMRLIRRDYAQGEYDERDTTVELRVVEAEDREELEMSRADHQRARERDE
jgi:hypothetical protein